MAGEDLKNHKTETIEVKKTKQKKTTKENRGKKRERIWKVKKTKWEWRRKIQRRWRGTWVTSCEVNKIKLISQLKKEDQSLMFSTMSESDSENSKRRGKTPKKKKIRKNDKKKSNPNNRKCVGERGKEKKTLQ